MLSLEGCEYWIAELNKNLGKCCKALVGNKDDLAEHSVTPELLAPFIQSDNIFSCFTSAKTGSGIKELFQQLIDRLPVRNTP